MSEDAEFMWQDVLDDVVAGRLQNLRCPFCHAAGKSGQISVEETEERTRLECRSCRRFLEGRFKK